MEPQATEITDSEIEVARLFAEELYDGIIENISEEDVDDLAVVYSLWTCLTRCLAEAGWSAEELTKDLVYHVTDQTTSGMA